MSPKKTGGNTQKGAKRRARTEKTGDTEKKQTSHGGGGFDES